MYARINVIETPYGDESRVVATLQGSADDAKVLYKLLNGKTFAHGTDPSEITEVTVAADKRVPSSPTYEPLDLGN